MGKRKERRLAALNNVGRRVKLDLFAEPPGHLGGSSTQEEDGGVLDLKCHAGLPKSPSSSDQKRDNPLLLLGQYSDDEVDVLSNTKLEDAAVESSLATDDLEVRESAAEECKELEVNSGDDLDAPTEKKQDAENDSNSQGAHNNLDGNNDGDTDSGAANQLSKDAVPTEHVSVYGTSDSVVTADAHSGWKMVLHEESQQYYYWNTETGETSWVIPSFFAPETEFISEQKTESTALLDNYKLVPELIKADDFSHICTSDTSNPVSEVGEFFVHDTQMCKSDEVHRDESLDAKSFGVELNQNGHYESCAGTSDMDKYMAGQSTSSECRNGADFCLGLIEHGESLLKRLNLLKESKDYLQGKDWASKYIMETEVRLSDVRALLPHGSSLLPLWEYSERQLKRLEGSIGEEINRSVRKTNVIEEPVASSIGEDGEFIVNTRFENGANCPLEGDADEKSIGVLLPTEPSPQSTFNVLEDVDMDVDMEVEDASPTNTYTIENAFGIGNFTSADDGLIVPPPPDEEWIPPPPPDSELIPPPPPDEPPEPSLCPYIPQFSDAEPYQLSYPSSGFQNFGQPITEVDGHHVDLPHQPVYYEMVPNNYADTSSEIVNPEVSSTASSGFIVESWPVIYSGVLPSQSGSLDVNPVVNVKADYSALSAVSSVGTLNLPLPSSSAPMHSVKRDNVSTDNIETSVTSIDGTSTTAKIGSKVSRSRKRTIASAPTLRSNKKVSKLLDKWKAAKEELDEEYEDEEDEPENAYDNLEKKRQKGIQAWLSQQIASGDAKDNANFQPLGGDWRERVKRRRAARERIHEGESVDERPNLLDLSRDLPPGWQALWDESSKQVYYGNCTTSETSWSKPGN